MIIDIDYCKIEEIVDASTIIVRDSTRLGTNSSNWIFYRIFKSLFEMLEMYEYMCTDNFIYTTLWQTNLWTAVMMPVLMYTYFFKNAKKMCQKLAVGHEDLNTEFSGFQINVERDNKKAVDILQYFR